MPPLVELLFVSRYNIYIYIYIYIYNIYIYILDTIYIYIYNRMDIMTPQMDGITDGKRGKRPELCTFKHSR